MRMVKGETPIEIMRGGHTAITEFWKDRERIKKAVSAVFVRGGGIEAWGGRVLLSY